MVLMSGGPAEEPEARFPDEQESGPIGVEGRPAKQSSSILEFLGELPILIISAILLAWLIKTFVAQPFVIPSASMAETLIPGDRVVVSKISYRLGPPKKGDIVVFEAPERSGMSDQDFIKRVVGEPGDEVEVKDGQLYVNGVRQNEPYAEPESPDSEFGPEKVPSDSYFVMGDNRPNSKDSRFFGAVERDSIVGKAVGIYWPPQRLGLVR